ncbi:MAG: tetratricopeptide repeat protein [Bacteroidota bacterium]
MKGKFSFFGIVLFFLLAAAGYAQKTKVYTNEDSDFKTGMDLFLKEKYGAAQHYFIKAAQKIKDKNSLQRIDAEYYAALCAVELFNKDAEEMLVNFINQHPESPKVKLACFNMGRYKFRKKQYQEAIDWFGKSDIYELSKAEVHELYFKRGYSYFELKDLENAKKDFFEIKDIDTKYTAPANYYYSHILYAEKNYESALTGFKKLLLNEDFAPIVPYYITQILYLQKKYDEVIAYAPSLLNDTVNSKRGPEIAKMIGESHYRLAQYSEAIPYFEKYKAASGAITRADWYELGFSYYKSGNCASAIEAFKNSAGAADSLAQSALYHMGDCYIKVQNKQLAITAFQAAHTIGADAKISEDALFNYAKLSYELSYNPFLEAIEAFEEYIRKYPGTPRTDEAYQYLVNVYLSCKNYEAAFKSIESIKNLDATMKPVYQKIAYYRAVQLFNDNDMAGAIKHFEKSLQYPVDKTFSALAWYWSGEAWYKRAEAGKNYEQMESALKAYKAFQFEQVAATLPMFNTVNYSMGYAYFKKGEWTSANTAFRKFISGKGQEDAAKINDACMRLADGYFMLKDYTNAEDYYDKALQMKTADSDYALYQKAIVLGLLDKDEAKAKTLEQMLASYGTVSEYTAAARYELGKTYLQMNELDKAAASFGKVVKEHPSSLFVANSLLQIGNIQNKQKKYDEAFQTLNAVVNKYPKSEVAMMAVETLREICKNKGDNDCLNDLKNLVPNISAAKLDSDNYEIGRNFFFEEKYAEASKSFQKYIQNYPDGIFTTEVYYYKAESDHRMNNLNLALGGYNFVADRPFSKYTEPAVARAAQLYFKMQNCELALKSYSRLETIAQVPANLLDARVGQMRCNFLQKNYDGAINYAGKVLQTEKISAELATEARMTIARSAFEKKDYELAKKQYDTVMAKNQNEKAAEAKYGIADIYFIQGQYKESQKLLFELISQKPSYGYWVTRSFILLSDNYVALGDYFNAKYALKTVIDKSTNNELVEQAKLRLGAILEMEKAELEKQQKEKMRQDSIHLIEENLEIEKTEGGQ